MVRQREGSSTIALGTGSGPVLRIGELGAGTRSPIHRTETLDYGICLEGECEMELDDGEVVTVRAGDVVIQRGTSHAWHNHDTLPFCLDSAGRRAGDCRLTLPVFAWAASCRIKAAN